MLVAPVSAIIIGLSAFPASAQEMQFFRIGTGTTGGIYFPIGGILGNALSAPPDSPICRPDEGCGIAGLVVVAQATSGSVENILRLRTGEFDSALVQADVAYWAFTGTETFEGEEPFAELRTIADLYVEDIHLVTTVDSGIEAVADLEGRRVSIGEEGSGTLVDARLILESHGLSEDRLDPLYLRPGPASDRLVSGEIDAFFMVGGYPVPAIQDAAERSAIRLIPLDSEAESELRAEHPFLVESRIPDGAYPGTDGVTTLGVRATWVVRADVPDDLVFDITRTLWHPRTLNLLATGHPKGEQIRPTSALDGIAVPLHPGAERYYDEQNMVIPDHATAGMAEQPVLDTPEAVPEAEQDDASPGEPAARVPVPGHRPEALDGNLTR